MRLALRPRWSVPALVTGLLLFASPSRAAIDPAKLKALRQAAEQHEHLAEWDKACQIYETILRLDRDAPDVRDRYQTCLRRYWQVRRHRDLSYRKEVLSLDYAQAVKLYTLIRDTLLDNALDRKKADPVKLFRRGLEELDNALSDPVFLESYLPAAKPHELKTFRAFLKKQWHAAANLTRPQAVKQLREVALAGQNILQLPCTIAMMEFACGACYALDEYTLYLTPNQLRELCDSLRGEFAGIGLTLRQQDGKILVHEIAPFSPVAKVMPPVATDDHVLAIDKKPTAQLPLETAQDLLEGPIGSLVEIELYSPSIGVRTLKLPRRALFMPSVVFQSKTDQVGYLHIACFQDTTPSEVEEALAAFTKAEVKALILDLRGNTGGLFESAIEVARKFLANGIIATTQNSDPKFDMVYQARNPGAYVAPLVVLIDGDTASAAEVLAGALRDNKRARLVGQTTFGKGCTQCVLKLPSAPGGIPTGGLRLTVARFFSPEGQPYTGRGVTPHIYVERFGMTMPGMDLQLEEALLEANRLLMERQ